MVKTLQHMGFFALFIVFFYWLIESLIEPLLSKKVVFLSLFFNPGFHDIWMRLIITVTLVGLGVFTQKSLTRFSGSEEKIEELYSLLISIRNINQLIVQETDLDELLQKSADVLLEARGYIDISIAVLKENKIVPVANSGPHERRYWSITPEGKGDEAPRCVREILETKSSKIISSVEEYCRECDFCEHGSDHRTVLVPLLHEKSLVGLLSVCLQEEREISDAELDLLEDIANDLAFAKGKIKAERKLQESGQRYRELFESVNVAIVVHDSKGRIISANPRAEEALKLEEKELKNKNLNYWNGILYKENGEPMKVEDSPISKAYKSKQSVEGTVVGISSKGEKGKIKWYILTAEPQLDEKEKVKEVIVSFKDITEQMDLEERKDFLNTILRQDLGSKLQAVQGYLQLLEDVNLSEKKDEYLEEISKMVRESVEILSFAKELREIEESDWSAEKDIVQVLEQVFEKISELIEGGEVEVEENYPPKIEKVSGDYSLNTLFLQILKTRIQKSDCDRIKISLKEREEKILVTIKDDGKPLPKDVKKIFSGGVYTGKTTGAGGVRYYIIRQIAEHNDGDIKAKDSELGGAKFKIQLKKITNSDKNEVGLQMD